MAGTTPPSGYTAKDSEKRRKWLREKVGFDFTQYDFEPEENFRGLIENHIGYMSLPLAIAGPLSLTGSYANGEFYVPICALEGTLSLSLSRGFFLSYLSGGITSHHYKQEISRSPIFMFKELKRCAGFVHWIGNNFVALKEAAESTTSHGTLLRIDSYPVQNGVILEFVYDTKEAAGQNMVTIATHRACKYIENNFDHQKGEFEYIIESNFSGDKNPAQKNILLGRGHHVIASTQISAKVLRRVMRVTAKDLVRAAKGKHLGSQLAGVAGLNIHTVNALSAIYLACGQDVACAAENAVGITSYEVRDDDELYVTLSMPSITVGTIGGGTRLRQQRRNLELIGCTGENSSKKLAEIVCASALALELSLAGAILSNEFADSHQRYGRG